MTDLPALSAAPLLPGPALDAARRYAERSLSPATLRAYKHDWAAFEAWCATNRQSSLPASPLVVATYAAAMATQGYAVAYIERNLQGIRRAHAMARAPNPVRSDEVHTVMQGIRREHRGVTRKDAVLRSQLDLALAAAPDSLAGLRDRALLLVGWAGALRRSELVAADVEHLESRGDEGLILSLPRSKTDQTGEREEWVALPRSTNPLRCPVAAVAAWREAAQVTEGALLRSVRRGKPGGRLSDHGAGEAVQRALRRAGVEGNWGAHSLRAGYATQAALDGKTLEEIMSQTRHRSYQVALGYVRRSKADAFRASRGML